MNNQGSFKNRKLLWEELAPTADPRSQNQDARTYGSISPSAEEATSRPLKPRLGFARRTSENLEPVQYAEPLPLEDDEEVRDFRPRRAFWRPRSKAGWAFVAIASVVILGVFTTGAIVLRNQILRNARFTLSNQNNLQMSGASEVSKADLMPVFNDDLGKNVFQVPLSARRKQLEQISWVQHATVMRVLPNQLRVSVVERTPVAFVRSTPEDQQIGLVDADGVLLKMPASLVAQRHYSFPVVTGVDAKDSPGERRKRMLVYTRLIHELDSGNRKLSEQISEIDLRDPNDARVLMPEAGTDILAHFGAEHFLTRYQTYQAHIGEWRQQYPKLTTVDLRYEQQVVLRQSDARVEPSQNQSAGAAQQQPVPQTTAQSAGPSQAEQSATNPTKPELSASVTSASTPAGNPSTSQKAGAKGDSKGDSPKTSSKTQKDEPKLVSSSQSKPSAGKLLKASLPEETKDSVTPSDPKQASSKSSDKPAVKKVAAGGASKKAIGNKSKKPTTKSKDKGKSSKNSKNASKSTTRNASNNASSSKSKKTASKTKPAVKKTAVEATHTAHESSGQ